MNRWVAPFWLDRVTGVAVRFLLVVGALAVVVALLAAIDVVVLPLLIGLLFAAGLRPISERLRGRGFRPAPAALGALGVLLLVGVFAVWLAATAIAGQWDDISNDLDRGADELEQEAVDADLAEPDQAADVHDDVSQGVEQIGDIVATGAFAAVGRWVDVIAALALSLLVTFFYLKDGAAMWRWVLGFAGGQGELLDIAGTRCFSTLAGYVRGVALVALVDGTLIGLGALVLGVPYAGAITVLTFFLSFIPYFGAVTAGAFACLLAVADGGIEKGLAMLVVVLLVQQLEGNLLQPVIVGRSVRLHPLVVALSVVAGGAISGFLGIVVAVPLTASVVTVGAVLREHGWFREDLPRRLFPHEPEGTVALREAPTDPDPEPDPTGRGPGDPVPTAPVDGDPGPRRGLSGHGLGRPRAGCPFTPAG